MHKLQIIWILIIILSINIFSYNKKEIISSINQSYTKSLKKYNASITIIDVKSKEVLYSKNKNKLLIPASTQKLYSTAYALEKLNVDSFPTTIIELRGYKSNDTLYGNLVIIAGGDPNISGRFRADSSVDALLNEWVSSITELNIKYITGSLKIIDTIFVGNGVNVDWKKHIKRWYAAPVSGIILNDNCVDFNIYSDSKNKKVMCSQVPRGGYWKIKNKAKYSKKYRNTIKYSIDKKNKTISIWGSLSANKKTTINVPVDNPKVFFKYIFTNKLSKSGIEFLNKSNIDSNIYKKIEFENASFLDIVNVTNKRSQNLFAEVLLRHAIGKKDSFGFSLSKLNEHIKTISKSNTDNTLKDACGLSALNRTTTFTTANFLSNMYNRISFGNFYNSLIIPGIDGVEKKRLVNTVAQTRFRSKTGFIKNVSAIAGYITTKDLDTIAVSIIINNKSITKKLGESLVDSFVVNLVELFNPNAVEEDKIITLMSSVDSIDGFLERLDFFTNYFIGSPYVSSPLGDGVNSEYEKAPLVNTKGFDCVTFMEHTLALAKTKSYDSFFVELNKIRYKNGNVKYIDRNHFFTADWITNNSRFVSYLDLPNTEQLKRKIGKNFFYGLKKIPYKEKDKNYSINYLSIDDAIRFFKDKANLKNGIYGVLFISKKLEWIISAHTGFIIKNDFEAKLRHASSVKKNKKVMEVSIIDYLRKKKKVFKGISIFNLEKKN